MATTYLKRQKEMKRLEKQREKTERRAQKKLDNRRQKEIPAEGAGPAGDESEMAFVDQPTEPLPQD
jgi:hypothetical protein